MIDAHQQIRAHTVLPAVELNIRPKPSSRILMTAVLVIDFAPEVIAPVETVWFYFFSVS